MGFISRIKILKIYLQHYQINCLLFEIIRKIATISKKNGNKSQILRI